MNSTSKLFINANIFTPDQVIKNGSLLVKNGKIETIFDEKSIEKFDDNADEKFAERVAEQVDEIVDVKGASLVPGFVDVHVHGGGGFDAMSGNPEDIDGMSQFHASHGTTSFLATTMTHTRSAIEKAVKGISISMKQGTKGAEVVGIHLEGPFLNAERCGAQNPEFIRAGTLEEMKSYIDISAENIRLMTIAPEQVGALDMIRYAVEQGITVSIGHSDATYEIVKQAVQAGAKHVTHLFNGMRPLHHREPGVAGAALMLDELAVELICDGIHIRSELVSYIFRIKPAEKVMLITDCISAAGCQDGEYKLGSLPVVMKDGQVRLKQEDGCEGSLAGSCLSMDQALRNAIEFTGMSLEEILPAITLNPTRQIGLENRKGSIEIGKDADLVILDKNYEVKSTFVKGRRVY